MAPGRRFRWAVGSKSLAGRVVCDFLGFYGVFIGFVGVFVVFGGLDNGL